MSVKAIIGIVIVVGIITAIAVMQIKVRKK